MTTPANARKRAVQPSDSGLATASERSCLRIGRLDIHGFRGVKEASIVLPPHAVLVGPNGCGKSTIVDALSLLCNRTKMVSTLTEHDFYDCTPGRTDRFTIVAHVVGFPGNSTARSARWFMDGRAIPCWLDPAGTVVFDPSPGALLCARIGFAARFDHDELEVESRRYFFDDLGHDPFGDDGGRSVPNDLAKELGYFVLPALRAREKALSFDSDLFRHVLGALGETPATEILAHRDRLRNPGDEALERAPGLQRLVTTLNDELARFFPTSPKLQLRLTATDTASLLKAIVPHYAAGGGAAIPLGRHGTGLLTLQTFLLLIQVAQHRGLSNAACTLALEEPELHVHPGLQRTIVHRARGVATQTLCTTHAPPVAAVYAPTEVLIVENIAGKVAVRPLLDRPLAQTAANSIRKLFAENREAVVGALMFPAVLVPEGRTDYEWLRLLAKFSELEDVAAADGAGDVPPLPFSARVGLIPTQDAAVAPTYIALARTRGGIVSLVDGDSAGDGYVASLMAVPGVKHVLQWPDTMAMESMIAWILAAEPIAALTMIQETAPELVGTLAEALPKFFGAWKTNYLFIENMAARMCEQPTMRIRVNTVLAALADACDGRTPRASHAHLRADTRSTSETSIWRIHVS